MFWVQGAISDSKYNNFVVFVVVIVVVAFIIVIVVVAFVIVVVAFAIVVVLSSNTDFAENFGSELSLGVIIMTQSRPLLRATLYYSTTSI